MTWVHVDDILIVAPPHRIASATAKIVAAIQEAGFKINERKSQLKPVQRLDYVGLNLDFTRRTYAVSDVHVRNLLALKPLFETVQDDRTAAVLRGFATFILFNSVRQYAPLSFPLPVLFQVLWILAKRTRFKMPFLTPAASTAPAIYTDATPFTLAWRGTESATNYGGDRLAGLADSTS